MIKYMTGKKIQLRYSHVDLHTKLSGGYEPLNLENRLSVNSGKCDATELSFLSVGHISFIYRARERGEK